MKNGQFTHPQYIHTYIHTYFLTTQEMRKNINDKREQYRPVATRGSVLYFTIVDMSQVRIHTYIHPRFFLLLGKNIIMSTSLGELDVPDFSRPIPGIVAAIIVTQSIIHTYIYTFIHTYIHTVP